jgi:hypothetical protein
VRLAFLPKPYRQGTALPGSRFDPRAARGAVLGLIASRYLPRQATFALRPSRQAARDKLSVVFGEDFPTTENAVAIDGIEFAKPSPTPRLVGGDQRRAGASEEIKNDAAAVRNILNGVGDHRPA